MPLPKKGTNRYRFPEMASPSTPSFAYIKTVSTESGQIKKGTMDTNHMGDQSNSVQLVDHWAAACFQA